MKKLLVSLFLSSTLCIILPSSAAAFHTDGADWNDGPLNIFPREHLFCGKGWRLPVLLWGDRPVSVCMFKPRRENRFGGSFIF